MVSSRDHYTGEDCSFNYVIPLDDNMKREAVRVPGDILAQSLPVHQFNLSGGYGIDNIPTGTNSPSEFLFVDIDGTSLVVRGVRSPRYIGTDGEVAIQITGARVSAPNDTRSAWADSRFNHSLVGDYEKRINQIVKIPSGGRMRIKGTSLLVPAKCRIFDIEGRLHEFDCMCEDTPGVNRQRQLALATFGELPSAISRREKLLNIKIYNDPAGYVISDETGKATDPLNKRAAAFELVKTYAIAPDTAKEMLSEVPSRGQGRYLAKLAAEANYMMAVRELDPSQTDTESVDLSSQVDGDIRTQIQQAADSGVKEIMDVTVLKLLAEDGSSVRMIQDMIPQLFSAMNAVGQILFMLRASVSMNEAYGDYRSGEMEKQFTKLIQRLGDAIIVLQRGRVDDVKDLLEGPLSATLG